MISYGVVRIRRPHGKNGLENDCLTHPGGQRLILNGSYINIQRTWHGNSEVLLLTQIERMYQLRKYMERTDQVLSLVLLCSSRLIL